MKVKRIFAERAAEHSSLGNISINNDVTIHNTSTSTSSQANYIRIEYGGNAIGNYNVTYNANNSDISEISSDIVNSVNDENNKNNVNNVNNENKNKSSSKNKKQNERKLTNIKKKPNKKQKNKHDFPSFSSSSSSMPNILFIMADDLGKLSNSNP